MYTCISSDKAIPRGVKYGLPVNQGKTKTHFGRIDDLLTQIDDVLVLNFVYSEQTNF